MAHRHGRSPLQLNWFDPQGARLPWIEMGGAPEPVVVTLPGLSDGLQPLSEPSGLDHMTTEEIDELPLRVMSLSHRHPIPEGTTTARLAADVARFIDNVVGHPVVVSGHSMGGMVAQHLAVIRPDLVSHLVLTATLDAPDEQFRAVLGRWDGWVAAGDWDAFYADADTTAFTGSELLRRWLVPDELISPPAAGLTARHHRLTAAALGHDATALVDRIQAPTLVMAGACDPVVDHRAARRLAERIPGAVYEELPGLAHGFPEQAPYTAFGHIARLLRIEWKGPR